MVGTEEPGLNPDNRGKYTISPNPAGRELTISTDPEIQGMTDIRVISLTGSIVHHSVHYLNKGDAQLKIPVREIPAGAYGVLITQNGQPPVHLKVIINR
jgi:hypothetical protein